jgi:C1A family cysteine protease
MHPHQPSPPVRPLLQAAALTLLAAAVTGNAGDEEDDRGHDTGMSFNDWRAQYGIVFATAAEAAEAKAAFMATDRRIRAHNQGTHPHRHRPPFTLGHNQFSGLTQRQFMERYVLATAMVPPRWLPPQHEAARHDLRGRATPAANSSWDWTEHGVVAPVQQQGSCGGCYAFSCAGALES